MILLGMVFDLVLAFALVFLAQQLLASAGLFRAASLFIAFGLLMTLVWVRLGAADVALAEAGIGTGFTGALLLAAIARLRRIENRPLTREDGPQTDEPHRN